MKNTKLLSMFLIIMILFSFSGITYAQTQPSTNLRVHFIDVGQADSILIQLPNNQTALIDAGNNADSDLVVNYIKKLNIKKIDYLIGTHPHEDHIGGLDKVIAGFSIGRVYLPKAASNTDTFMDVLTAIKAKGIKVTEPKAGTDIISIKDLKFTILAPNSAKYDETNEYSIVTKLVYKDNSFLFTGDAEKISENEMIKKKFDLKADVLKVGHHGGKTSTTYEFLKRVAPKYAVISVGKDNDYGHPTKDVLDRLKIQKAEIYRTDLSGTIIASSDGKKITFNKKPIVDKVKEKTNNSIFPQVPSFEMPTEPTKPVKPSSNFSTIVFASKENKIYHSSSCSLSDGCTPMSLSEAKESRYAPCDKCNPQR